MGHFKQGKYRSSFGMLRINRISEMEGNQKGSQTHAEVDNQLGMPLVAIIDLLRS